MISVPLWFKNFQDKTGKFFRHVPKHGPGTGRRSGIRQNSSVVPPFRDFWRSPLRNTGQQIQDGPN